MSSPSPSLPPLCHRLCEVVRPSFIHVTDRDNRFRFFRFISLQESGSFCCPSSRFFFPSWFFHDRTFGFDLLGRSQFFLFLLRMVHFCFFSQSARLSSPSHYLMAFTSQHFVPARGTRSSLPKDPLCWAQVFPTLLGRAFLPARRGPAGQLFKDPFFFCFFFFFSAGAVSYCRCRHRSRSRRGSFLL